MRSVPARDVGQGAEVVFVNNPDYNGPWAAYWQQIVYLIGADEAVFPAYENGEIDLIERGYEQVISPADQARIESDPELSAQLHKFPQFQTWWLAFGDEGTAFSDLKVRQAFAQAVDRDAIINSVLRGQAVPAYGLLAPGFHSSNTEAQKAAAYPYDPEAARALLAEAGYGEGGDPFPAYDLTLRDPSPTVQTVAQAIQAMLKENLGIDVGIQSLERKTFTDQLNAHELPFVLIPWDMDYYDASNFMDVFVTGGRHAWSNAEYDALVKEADGIVGDEARRAELYQQAEEILITDVGGVFLWHPGLHAALEAVHRGSLPARELLRHPLLAGSREGAAVLLHLLHQREASLSPISRCGVTELHPANPLLPARRERGQGGGVGAPSE